MNKTLKIAILPAFLVAFSAVPALADVAPDPCMGKMAGDMCTSPAGKAGTCVADPAAPMTLICQESTGAGGGSASSSSSSTGSSGQPNEPADDDEDGCSLTAAGAATHGTPALFLAGLALFAAAYLRRRRA